MSRVSAIQESFQLGLVAADFERIWNLFSRVYHEPE